MPFRLVLKVREQLLARGVLRTRRLGHPVISIGNLTLGGTGKTPLTIFLAERMRALGFKPVILSRGYRRRTRGTVIVSRFEGPVVPWQDAGDEPFLMARRLGDVPVIVSESRYQAGLAAERGSLGNLFLLDDGFQHRGLHRDIDLVTIDPAEWQAGETLIPFGRWREPRSAIVRAHAACVQDGPQAQNVRLPIPRFIVGLENAGIFRNLGRLDKDRLDTNALHGRSITALAGIAKPGRFFTTLSAMGIRVNKEVAFPDHHNFTDAELRQASSDIVITTEKDAVRIGERDNFYALRVSATMTEFDELRDLILARLTNS